MANTLVRQIILFLIAGVLIITSGAVTSAQTSYAIPKKVPLERVVRTNFPSYFGRRYRYPQLIAEQFFPVGWSRDGKFAYYIEPVDEACGCYYAHLVIQDMRTDKVIWEFKYNQGDLMDANGKMPPEDNIRKLWRKNARLFSDKLREHAIEASSFELFGKTFASGGRSYTAKAAITMGQNPDGDYPRVNKLKLLLSTPKLGSKQLYSADHSKEEYWFTLDAGVIGGLKSPFESRIALILIEVNRGYEGPPHTADIQIVGADLQSGFEKGK